jgi:deoxyribonuclease V
MPAALTKIEARFACVDVDYRDQEAVAACVLFADWGAGESAAEWVEHLPRAAPYEPGRFYLRELPCLLTVLRRAPLPLQAVVIDSYVWLGEGEPGLGAHLYQALGGAVAVIGVAKTRYRGAAFAVPVLRGGSQAPLYITAAGLPKEEAAGWVRGMHGAHRIPTLLRRVDRLARTG